MDLTQRFDAEASLPTMTTSSETALDQAAQRENFPVASRLLAPRARARVVAFYRYARLGDDIADDPDLSTPHKLDGLQTLEDGLDGELDDNAGAALRKVLNDGSSGDAQALEAARHLLAAFRRDSCGISCTDWTDLMSYCDASAVPVGRFLLAVHGEDASSHGPSDALCAALQVLNHLQDLSEDKARLDRRYLPGDWMGDAGAAESDLTAAALSPTLRAVVQRTLDATDELIVRAGPLPSRIKARGLRAQAAATLALARRLAQRLRTGDPLAHRVALTKLDFARAALTGLWAAR